MIIGDTKGSEVRVECIGKADEQRQGSDVRDPQDALDDTAVDQHAEGEGHQNAQHPARTGMDVPAAV
jgi:hypothetical protein